ncbi:MAG: FkbM family methyltransferase [Vicinamibacterales bacterium]
MSKSKLALVLVVTLPLVGVAAYLSPRGQAFATHLQENRRCCQLPFLRAAAIAWDEATGNPAYPSEIGQDKWVAEAMFPGVRDGVFLDVGSGHGQIGSNTRALEDRGWTGICVDPFPTAMEGRTCRMVTEVVSSEAGKKVMFHTHDGLGGIADTLGKWKDEASKAPAVELTTVTLGQVLDQAGAPAFIHFLSLDIEGAELDALRGIPFDKYRFGAMAIEHNEEEPKRADIIGFLETHGYRRVHTYKQDDFFAPR